MNSEAIMEKMPIYIANGKPSDDTIKAYKRLSRTFISWLFKRGKYAEQATKTDAAEYVFESYKEGRTADTVNQRIAAARAFYKTAIIIGEFKEENPFAEIKGKMNEIAAETTNYFTNEEVQKIYDTCENDRERALILLMAIEGLRTVEVERMKIADYIPEQGKIRIHGKGGREAYIYPSDKTQEILQKYIGDRTTGMVFENEIDRSPITREGIKWLVNRILRKAKLKRKGLSCHALRHSCGTNLYAATKDIRLVQETLRHTTPEVTSRYAHVVNRKNATNAITVK